jgi:hypothetical protein
MVEKWVKDQLSMAYGKRQQNHLKAEMIEERWSMEIAWYETVMETLQKKKNWVSNSRFLY